MERYYYAALADLLGYQAPNRVRELVSYFGSAKAAFRAGSRDLKASGLLKEGLLSYYEEMYQGDLPEQIYDYCETHQVAVVTEYSEEYPPGLRELSSPPAVLYRKGTFPSWKRTLGVVGSRKATAYGLENARSFARYLAGQGVTVPSALTPQPTRVPWTEAAARWPFWPAAFSICIRRPIPGCLGRLPSTGLWLPNTRPGWSLCRNSFPCATGLW